MSATDRTAILETSHAVDTGERWKVLCEQASNEQDPAKLLEIVQTINALLSEREARRIAYLTVAKTPQQN